MSISGNSVALRESQIVKGYFALGFLIALLVAIIPLWAGPSRDSSLGEETSTERIRPAADLELAPLTATAIRGKRTGAALVEESCQSCHRNGLGGAPKIGDRKSWAPRLGKGLDALVQSAIAGNGSMPPRGGSDADDRELARAIVYMIWPRMRL